ncbi:MAG: hypothetical protein EXS16_01655 [Gemmataceae bacterium]|nr:hypothetical protein [Gemmataceae bacterium]
MPFVYLLLLALICMQTRWPAPPGWLTPAGCAILVGTFVIASWLTAGLIAKVIRWQLIRQSEFQLYLLRRYGRARRYHFIAIVVAYLAALYFFGWGDVATTWMGEALTWFTGAMAPTDDETPERLLVGRELVLLAPFFLALLFSWERFYRVEKTAYEVRNYPDHFITKRAYLLAQIRNQWLFVVPPIVLLLFNQVLLSILPESRDGNRLLAALATLTMASAFLLLPLLLRLFLGLKPMPPGPLRERLESTARRLKFRFSNILVWDTRNQVANALVTGFVPWLRYVILTDRLIDELTPDEIEAVFGHEVGHIHYRHLFFYLAFFVVSFVLLGLLWENAAEWVRTENRLDSLQGWITANYSNDEIEMFLATVSSFCKLVLMAAYTLFVFGYLSRRCERQADLFGSSTVSTEVFINALEKVADINGIPREGSGNWLVSWQHPTIGQRIDFLREMQDHPADVASFHRSLLMLQLACYVALGLLLWCYNFERIWELVGRF